MARSRQCGKLANEKQEMKMTGRIDARLGELGITLPQPIAPVANYVPFVVTGNLVFISGQVSWVGDRRMTGKVGGPDGRTGTGGGAALCPEHPGASFGRLWGRSRPGKALRETRRLRELPSGVR